jgi:hypothetical protein
VVGKERMVRSTGLPFLIGGVPLPFFEQEICAHGQRLKAVRELYLVSTNLNKISIHLFKIL